MQKKRKMQYQATKAKINCYPKEIKDAVSMQFHALSIRGKKEKCRPVALPISDGFHPPKK